MKATIKSSIILILTLFVGIAIGFELNGIMLRHRFESAQSMRRPGGFVNLFEDIIQPDNNQRQIIEPIILKYHTQIDKISKMNMGKVGELIDSMHAELRPKLSKEQESRLQERIQHMKNFPPPDKMSKPRQDWGPGPGPGWNPDAGGHPPVPGREPKPF